MRVGFVINLYKDKTLSAAKKILGCFLSYGLDVSIDNFIPTLSSEFPNIKVLSFQDLISNNDIIAVAGGDGTVLRIAKECAKQSKPVLGINIGKLGFLTEAELNDIDIAANALKLGKYTIEHRTMLQLFSGSAVETALNEIVLLKEASARIINFDVYASGQLIDSYNADGFIVSTPTGSTAYSLSAGGPLLSPDIKGMVLTPVCSHSLRSRPIVIGENEIVTIKINTPSAKAQIIADGIPVIKGIDLMNLKISKCEISAGFVRIKPSDFYKKLLSKLNIWSTGKE